MKKWQQSPGSPQRNSFPWSPPPHFYCGIPDLGTGVINAKRKNQARRGGGGAGAQSAKDILGADIKAADWLKSHPQPGARELTQGLKVQTKRRKQPRCCGWEWGDL
eukprot:1162141-Pelagomonas_calceolata.AAC.2